MRRCSLPSHGYCQTSHLHKPAAEDHVAEVGADEVDGSAVVRPCEVAVLGAGSSAGVPRFESAVEVVHS